MICPLMSRINPDRLADAGYTPAEIGMVDCLEHRCRFWHNGVGECAIVATQKRQLNHELLEIELATRLAEKMKAETP